MVLIAAGEPQKCISSSIRPVTTTGQFCAKAVPGRNLEAVSRIITDAAKAGAKMIFLPEASDFIARANEVASLTKPLAQSEFVQGVRAKAKETGVWVSVGIHETVCALQPPPPPSNHAIHNHIWCPVITHSSIGVLCFTELRPKTWI